MTDQPPQSPFVNKTIQASVAFGALAFAMATIVWCFFWGDPANAIHFYTTGAAWWTLWVLLGSFGLLGAAVSIVSIFRVTR